MSASLVWARRALWAQITLTALAVVAIVAAPFVIHQLVRTGGPAIAVGLAVASPMFVLAPLLIGAAVTGLVAVRRDIWRLRASIALFTPCLFVVGSGIEALLGSETPEVDSAAGPPGYERFVELTLRVLTGAHWLALISICCGAVAAVLLLRSRPTPEGPAA